MKLEFAMHKEGREILTQAMIIQAGRSILGFIVVPASVRIQEVIYTLIVQIETSRTRVAIVIGSCQSAWDKLRYVFFFRFAYPKVYSESACWTFCQPD